MKEPIWVYADHNLFVKSYLQFGVYYQASQCISNGSTESCCCSFQSKHSTSAILDSLFKEVFVLMEFSAIVCMGSRAPRDCPHYILSVTECISTDTQQYSYALLHLLGRRVVTQLLQRNYNYKQLHWLHYYQLHSTSGVTVQKDIALQQVIQILIEGKRVFFFFFKNIVWQVLDNTG